MSTIYGTSGNDSIYTNDEQISVFAKEGDDLLSAGSGNDYLYGDEGNDSLFSPGSEYSNVHTTLSGGSGNDTFVIPTSNSSSYSNSVVISDYEVGDNINIIGDSSNNGEAFNLSFVYYGSGDSLVTEIFNQESNELVATVYGTNHFYM